MAVLKKIIRYWSPIDLNKVLNETTRTGISISRPFAHNALYMNFFSCYPKSIIAKNHLLSISIFVISCDSTLTHFAELSSNNT